MPELGAWINHSSTWRYWVDNIYTNGDHPQQPSDLPDLLAKIWNNSNRESWHSFLGLALVGAASEGNLQGVKQLLFAGATLHSRDRNGLTPLHLASHRGHASVVTRLLADEDELSLGPPPSSPPRLMWQSSKEGSHLVPTLSLKKKMVVDARDNVRSCPLHLAAASGSAHVMRLLLHNGADPSTSNGYRQTPLHTAATCECESSSDSVKLLVDAGSDVRAIDNAGRTPLHAAAFGGTEATISALVSAGADIEAKGSIGRRTPLHEACARLRVESVKVLLNLGADESALDSDGRTPGDVVGEGLTPGGRLDPGAEARVRCMLDGAPKDKTWRRRRLLVLLRWRQSQMLLTHQFESGVPSGVHNNFDGSLSVVAIATDFEEGLFRNVVRYL